MMYGFGMISLMGSTACFVAATVVLLRHWKQIWGTITEHTGHPVWWLFILWSASDFLSVFGRWLAGIPS